MLNLFGLAAGDEQINHRASESHVLSPESFAVAIAQVSEIRIKELEEEYPWLTAIRPVFAEQQVPMSRAHLVELLADIHWGSISPPSTGFSPEEIINTLLQIGILRITEDRRIHVPDIYLYGFGLKRKGGIRRP